MAKKEPIFTEGFIFKPPRKEAPEWIKASISIKVSTFKEFLDRHAHLGWVNIDVKKSQKGSLYTELDTFRNSADREEQEALAQHDSQPKAPVAPVAPSEPEKPSKVSGTDIDYPQDINPEDIPF